MKNLEQNIKKYLKERGWNGLRPSDVAKSISIEAGELLELFQWTNDSLGKVKNNREKVELIKKELADVLIYCIDMSVILGFDTEKIIYDKLEKIKQKYPPELVKKRSTKDSPANDNYWKIKKEHRMKGLS